MTEQKTHQNYAGCLRRGDIIIHGHQQYVYESRETNYTKSGAVKDFILWTKDEGGGSVGLEYRPGERVTLLTVPGRRLSNTEKLFIYKQLLQTLKSARNYSYEAKQALLDAGYEIPA